jgi:hypothetical protein
VSTPLLLHGVYMRYSADFAITPSYVDYRTERRCCAEYFLYPVTFWQKPLSRHMETSKHIPAAPTAATHRCNSSSAASAGHSPTDGDITARIKAAFGALPDLIALWVGVDARDGVVTLTRSVESRMQTEAAVAIAAHVAGVKYVNDHLIASPRPSRHEAEPHTHRIPSLWTATGRGRHE